MSCVTYRPACHLDAEAVRRLGSQSYHPGLCESEATVSSIIAFGQSWMALQLDAVVGYALVRQTDDPLDPPHLLPQIGGIGGGGVHRFIHDVCVKSTHRSQGIGRALVRRAMLDVSEATSLVSLEGAVWFWVQFGFAPHRGPTAWEYRKEYGEGSMLMIAKIAE